MPKSTDVVFLFHVDHNGSCICITYPRSIGIAVNGLGSILAAYHIHGGKARHIHRCRIGGDRSCQRLSRPYGIGPGLAPLGIRKA